MESCVLCRDRTVFQISQQIVKLVQFFFCLRSNVFSALGISTSFLSKAFFPIVLLSLASEKSILLFAEQRNPFSSLLYHLLSRIEKTQVLLPVGIVDLALKQITIAIQVLDTSFHMVGSTKLDSLLQVFPSRDEQRGKTPAPLKGRPPPQFAGNSHPNAVQDAASLLCCKDTLLAHGQLVVHQDHQVLF